MGYTKSSMDVFVQMHSGHTDETLEMEQVAWMNRNTTAFLPRVQLNPSKRKEFMLMMMTKN